MAGQTIPGCKGLRFDQLIEPNIHRFPDRCCAVVVENRRGPCAPSKIEAVRRFCKSGLIADFSPEHER